jgi:hypothetical protein
MLGQAATVAALTTKQLFWWGAVGGAIGTVVVYVLPSVIRLATLGVVDLTIPKVIGILILLVILSAIGGVGPFLPKVRPTSVGDAITLGIGALAAIKALLAAAADATAPPPPPPPGGGGM